MSSIVPDITPGQVSLDQSVVLPTEEKLSSVQVVITRGWNAYMVQVVLKQNGQSRMLVGKEVTSYAVAENRREGICGHAWCCLGEGRSGFEVAFEGRKLLTGSRGLAS